MAAKSVVCFDDLAAVSIAALTRCARPLNTEHLNHFVHDISSTKAPSRSVRHSHFPQILLHRFFHEVSFTKSSPQSFSTKFLHKVSPQGFSTKVFPRNPTTGS